MTRTKLAESKIRSILFVTYHFPPEVGGIQTRIANYCSELTRRGISVTVLFPSRQGKLVGTSSFAGAQVMAVPGRMQKLPRNASMLIRLIVAKRVDVVHVFTGASTVLGLFALVLGRVAARSSTMSVFGKEDLFFSSFFSKMCFLVSSNIATTISANSRATGSLLPHNLEPKMRILLGGAPMVNNSGALCPSSSNGKEVLFVGRLARRKGVDDLLESFRMIERSLPAASLVIVGDGPERGKLEVRARELGLQTVEFRGALFGDALQREYSQCSVCVLPSKKVPEDPATEGLGLTLIEASMHAKPLIGTNHGGIPEIIREGCNGLLVPEGSPRKLADAIFRILSDEKMASAMGRKAFEIANSNFGWKAATERLLESYS